MGKTPLSKAFKNFAQKHTIMRLQFAAKQNKAPLINSNYFLTIDKNIFIKLG